jgi:hypothetical protein
MENLRKKEGGTGAKSFDDITVSQAVIIMVFGDKFGPTESHSLKNAVLMYTAERNSGHDLL